MGKKDYIIQSGVVPWLIQDNQLMIVLITARKPVCKWILPKGHIEKDLPTELSAANDAYEEAGIKGVKAKVEWVTAGDDRVCEECAGLEAEVFTLDQARGLIPLHPNCRCAWIPVVTK